MPHHFYSAQKKVAAEGVDWPPHIATVNKIEGARGAIEKRISVIYSFLENTKSTGKSIISSFAGSSKANID